MNQSVEAIYTGSDYYKPAHTCSPRAFDLIVRYRASKFSPFVSPRDEVLDFGAGAGWNIIGLQVRRRVAYDVTAVYAEQLRSLGVEFTSDLETLPANAFDVVIVSHVLEHLIDPAKTLADLGRLLKPSGKLVAIVPLERRLRTPLYPDPNHHLYCWNANTFNNLLNFCGYAVKSCVIGTYGFDRLAAELSIRLKGGMWLYRFLMAVLRLMRPAREIQAIAMPADA